MGAEWEQPEKEQTIDYYYSHVFPDISSYKYVLYKAYMYFFWQYQKGWLNVM